jgi:glucose-6-phosphate isomerase
MSTSTPLTQLPAWQALREHHRAIAGARLTDLFAADPRRVERLSMRCGELLLDCSKNLVTAETLRLLGALARACELPRWIERLLRGERVNSTEHRPALHTALRAAAPVVVDGTDVRAEAARTLARMRRFCDGVRGGELTGFSGQRYTDIVNIGIGGSDLGPALVADALAPYGSPQLATHFVSNVDGAHLAGVLARLNPETTLFVVASKTFTTLETLANARTAREWLLARSGDGRAAARHFAAVTANVAAAREFGVDPAWIFEFWDWVGGRYSVWSAVGLAPALAIGMDHFEALLAGAREMDEHFAAAPLERNLPAVLGLIGVWNVNFCGMATHAVLPYDQRLALLPDYLQQLEMESNGKRVTREGAPLDHATAPVVWGAPGTNGQHAFFQLLHQGTQVVPADFVACCRSHHALGSHHDILVSNFLAQTEALMRGRTVDEARQEMQAQKLPPQEIERLLPHRVFPGNRPSTSIVLGKLDPHGLGLLLALYEHKVYVQSVIWGINAFDQWGVELGKTLANRILPELTAGAAAAGHDASTNALIDYFRTNRQEGK